MALFQARRDCNPGGVLYRQGQVADFAAQPDAELFRPVSEVLTAPRSRVVSDMLTFNVTDIITPDEAAATPSDVTSLFTSGPVPRAPDPAGRALSEADKLGIMSASRPRKAGRKAE